MSPQSEHCLRRRTSNHPSHPRRRRRPRFPAMAVTKLNPSAAPFHCSRRHLFFAPPPPPPPMPAYQYHATGACAAAAPPPFPFFATYSCASLPFHGHLYPPCGYQAQMGPAPPGAAFAKGVLAAAPPPPPHGRPPHKLMVCKGAPTVTDVKLRAQARRRRVWALPPPCGVATGAGHRGPPGCWWPPRHADAAPGRRGEAAGHEQGVQAPEAAARREGAVAVAVAGVHDEADVADAADAEAEAGAHHRHGAQHPQQAT